MTDPGGERRRGAQLYGDPIELSSRSPLTVRARCLCTWWVATEAQLYKLFCDVCSVNIRPCTDRDFADANVIDVVHGEDNESKRSHPLRKQRKRDKSPSDGASAERDRKGDRGQSGLW